MQYFLIKMKFLETYTYHNRNVELTYIKDGSIITTKGVFLHFYFRKGDKSFPALFIPKKWKYYFSKLYNSLTEIHKEHHDVWYAIHDNKEVMKVSVSYSNQLSYFSIIILVARVGLEPTT